MRIHPAAAAAAVSAVVMATLQQAWPGAALPTHLYQALLGCAEVLQLECTCACGVAQEQLTAGLQADGCGVAPAHAGERRHSTAHTA